jgi:uncharacterized repeat protein (TIGR03803 family)
MKSLSRTRVALVAVITIFAAVLSAQPSLAATINVLYTFAGGTDGADPYGGLIFDSAGNLYGTTVSGGVYGGGTVFELKLNADGTYSETVLHSFDSNTGDGAIPYCSLAIDKSGNLYGTTYYGGTYGNGTVFELAHGANGTWKERILHHFNANAKDGFNPYAGIVLDSSGNLYGAAYSGGSYGSGTVFELARTISGRWQYKILHGFNYTNGSAPMGSLIFDAKGNLYGTTQYGGSLQHGVVFELIPNSIGTWSEKVLHTFNPNGSDGYAPYSGLAMDSKGNLYGTTLYGGISSSQGSVYQLSLTSKGWKETVIHSFAATGDGIDPYGPPVVDSNGNVYGTTWQSLVGNVGGAGIVYELSPTGVSWQETILNNFIAPEQYGNPYSGLILDQHGNLYGTAYGGSVVYEVTP